MLLIGLVVLLSCVVGGVALIVTAFRKPPEPPAGELPVAQIADGYSRIADRGRGKRRVVGNVVRVVVGVGVGLLSIPVLVYRFLQDLSNMKFESKGRILRLRGKARLPEVVKGGGGWSDGTVRGWRA